MVSTSFSNLWEKKFENFEQSLLKIKVNMKIINKKNIKRYTRKEKGKWKTLIVKEKKIPSILVHQRYFTTASSICFNFAMFKFNHYLIRLDIKIFSLLNIDKSFFVSFLKDFFDKFFYSFGISFQILTPGVLNPNKL